MGYQEITKQQFVEIMSSLTNQSIWLKVFTNVVSVDVNYPEFEFLEFTNNKYQFGHLNYEEENYHQNVMIEIKDIDLIHRCSMSPTVGAEQIILTLNNDVKIFLETENC